MSPFYPECSSPPAGVLAVLLHVLTTNHRAIAFYQRRQFLQHNFLPYYYSIGGRLRDGFSYVRYVNGGHAPWTALDHVAHWCQTGLGRMCHWPLRLLASAAHLVSLLWTTNH